MKTNKKEQTWNVGRKGTPPEFHAHVAGWFKSNDIPPKAGAACLRGILRRITLRKTRSPPSPNEVKPLSQFRTDTGHTK